MKVNPLPSQIRGQWIWHPDSLDKLDSYVYFRQEFTLGETPTLAELWLTAETEFHLYVNGRHVSRGPGPSPANGTYTTYIDVGYCLQVGRNVIAVLAHNTQVARYAHPRRRAGFWCQLNCENDPIVWSDPEWKCIPADCFMPNQPRVSRADAFVETVDLRRYLPGWFEADYEDEDWDHAVGVYLEGQTPPALLPCPAGEMVSEPYVYFNLILVGEAAPIYATAHVAFNRAVPGADGLFVAETYVHCKKALQDMAFGVFSDDPYYLFVNDKLVKSQGTRKMSNWTVPDWDAPRLYQQDALTEVSGWLSLNEGANRVVLVQQVGPFSAGTTLVFPETEAAQMRFLRGADTFSLPGWNLAGPLRIPFANVSESISLEHIGQQYSYYGSHPIDIAAHLHAYAFTVLETTEEPIEFIELRPGQYAVLELEKYVRGCPEFVITGAAGDQVDIVYGDYLTDTVVLPYEIAARRVFTLTLDGEPTHWTTMGARGMRYIMFFARQTNGNVMLQDLAIRREVLQIREGASFACSDELINQIWEASVNTLEATYDRIFLTSSGGQESQMLGDAMIQAISSFYLFGNYNQSEKALREFADAQYETGEIPAMAPSEFNVRYHDFGLLWIVWLQRHILHSGDIDFGREMLPKLERLLVFFESVAAFEDLLLGAVDAPFTLPVLIDYDQKLETRGVSTALNCLYTYALLKSEWIFRECGEEDMADVCNQRATQVAKALRRIAWDDEKGLFADAVIDGKQSARYSLQTNVLALYSGVAFPERIDAMFDQMFVEYAPFHEMDVDQLNDNPYFKFFVLDMAYTLDRRDWATDYMRYYWGKMLSLDTSTWWRTFSPDMEYGPENSGCLCHGYGVSPVGFLISELLGLRPATPGYRQVYFNPLLTAVEWARAQIHTPLGVIHIDWGYQESGELEISIDATYGLELLPLLNRDVAATAVIKVSNQVTILEPLEDSAVAAEIASPDRRPAAAVETEAP